jgi:hypothetical protein
MKRRLKIAALVFGSLVVVVVSLLAWVIYTEAGLRFAVARPARKMGKVTLKIEDVQGTIAGGFRRAWSKSTMSSATCASRTAARASTSGPSWSGRISVRRADADLVVGAGQTAPQGSTEDAAQFPAAPA